MESLRRTVEDNERTAQERTEELQNDFEKLEFKVGDMARALIRLEDSMGWFQRHIRASGAVTEVAFDDQTGELAVLVRKVKRAQQAQAMLLTEAARRRLEGFVALFAQRAQRIDALTSAALQASATLSTTNYGQQGHATAATAFRAAFTTRRSETKLHRQQQTQAEQVRARLARDEQQRNSHAATIRAGKAAAQTMRLRLRTMIVEALGAMVLPPVWFTTALGITPPQRSTEEWLDTATEILAYRITYRVTDPVLALGATPNPSTTPDQYQTHQELTGRLHRYRS